MYIPLVSPGGVAKGERTGQGHSVISANEIVIKVGLWETSY